jgi:hypothetical protein
LRFKQDNDTDQVIESLHRFVTRFGTLSIMRLAFASARFLMSSLIFSIRLLVSGL